MLGMQSPMVRDPVIAAAREKLFKQARHPQLQGPLSKQVIKAFKGYALGNGTLICDLGERFRGLQFNSTVL
jgi:hypothetical protein